MYVIELNRFKEVAKLHVVCWLEIRGRIETRMLSPSTTYKAYLVYKLTGRTFGLDWAAVVTVGTRACGFDYECPNLEEIMAGQGIKHSVFLAPQRVIERELELRRRRQMRPNQEINEAKFPNESRADGWLEMELGEFHCRGDEDGELEMICCEIKTGMSKRGLLVQGIEIRPERK